MDADPTDTIVAIASPPGRGGVGVVRLSGPRAAAIAAALFEPARRPVADAGGGNRGAGAEDGAAEIPVAGGAMTDAAAAMAAAPPARRLRFGRLRDAAGATLDHGYLVVFDPPRTFTGEPSAELWAHGSPVVLRLLVEAAVARGARPATPGEFTLRAFLNGRIDLTRAEAIRDLIEARTVFQAKVAADQSRGRIAAAVDALKDRVAGIIARLEASIEFAEEGEAPRFLPEGGIAGELRAARAAVEALAGTYARGRLVRDGCLVVIVGSPNAGKSSIFNSLLLEGRAIVTPVAGTTRDLLEETIDLGGVPARLADTAGLHPPRDAADAEAVRRARRALEEADILVVVVDRSRRQRPDERALLDALENRRALVALNKSDLGPGIGADDLRALRDRRGALEVSAKTGAGIETLRARLAAAVAADAGIEKEGVFVTNLRHRDLLQKSAAALARAAGAAGDGLPAECLLIDLHDALDRLGEITGGVGIEGIYERIFRDFCIGK
jgi:tRNA modification GTPase